jgi:hypothetical protein
MNWEDHTLHTIKKLLGDEAYQTWAESIQKGSINDFSPDLGELLARLAGIIISEFEVSPNEKDKIVKVMELAAVAGKTL